MATQTAWRMRGDVMEACSCATTCPCNFGSDPIPLPCEVVIGWRIADGHYGNTRLDGLNVVLYGRIPGNFFQGNLTVGVYLDQRADQRQAQALENIFSGQAGGWPSVLGPLFGNLLAPQAGADPVRDGRRRAPHHGAWAVGGRVGASAESVVGTAAPRLQSQRSGSPILYGSGPRAAFPDAEADGPEYGV